jgi:hypothetical protein
LGYNLDDINFDGENLCWLAELDTSLAVVTASLVEFTNCINLGHIKDFSNKQTPNKREAKNEKGKTAKTAWTFDLPSSGTLMQSGKSHVNFLSDTVKGKQYLQYKKQFVKGSGEAQEYFSLVNVAPQHDITTPNDTGGTMVYESTGFFPDANITFTSATIVSIETALSIAVVYTGSVVITATKGYEIYET